MIKALNRLILKKEIELIKNEMYKFYKHIGNTNNPFHLEMLGRVEAMTDVLEILTGHEYVFDKNDR